MELVHFSDCGPYRETNQDAYCVRIAVTAKGTVAMAVVCDGMGGLQYGELASATVINAFVRWFEEELPALTQSGIHAEQVNAQWNRLLQEKHRALVDFAAERQIQTGTTVSAVLLTADKYYLMQVGDSRVYVKDGDKVLLVTQDQTLAMREYLAGRITSEEFATDSRRNILTQCVGSRTLSPVFMVGKTPATGGVLVCSDGFYHNINKQMIGQAMSVPSGRAALNQSLMGLGIHARQQGETDNFTAAVLRWDSFEDTSQVTVALMPEDPGPPHLDYLAKVTFLNAEPLM